VSQSIACSVDVKGVCIPVHPSQEFLNVRIPNFLASGQSGTGMNKNADAVNSLVLE
jgi:hypothetical protein